MCILLLVKGQFVQLVPSVSRPAESGPEALFTFSMFNIVAKISYH